MKKLIFIVLFLFVLVIGGYYTYTHLIVTGNPDSISKIIFENGPSLYVKIADTPSLREKGLMFQRELSDDSGILFIFDDEMPRNFWMKNTFIPLDMIFVDKNKKIVNIVYDTRPCNKDPCRDYSSEVPAMYVIEVNSGYSLKNKIYTGQIINFK